MTQEFIHDYKGYGAHPSQCLVKIFTDDGETFICFINISGTSVTNASEQLAQEIVNKFNLSPKDCRFFETYQEFNYDSFDEIEFSWDLNQILWEAHNPRWKPVNDFDDGLKKLFTEE